MSWGSVMSQLCNYLFYFPLKLVGNKKYFLFNNYGKKKVNTNKLNGKKKTRCYDWLVNDLNNEISLIYYLELKIIFLTKRYEFTFCFFFLFFQRQLFSYHLVPSMFYCLDMCSNIKHHSHFPLFYWKNICYKFFNRNWSLGFDFLFIHSTSIVRLSFNFMIKIKIKLNSQLYFFLFQIILLIFSSIYKNIKLFT